MGQGRVFQSPAFSGPLQLSQLCFHPANESFVHGVFFLTPVGTARQDKQFLSIRSGDQFDLHAFLDRLPILFGQVVFKLTQHCFGGAHNIRTPSLLNELQVGFTDHPPVHDPYPVGPPVLGFHRDHDVFHGLRIVRIAVKHFVAQRYSVVGHDQPDAHLQTVRP